MRIGSGGSAGLCSSPRRDGRQHPAGGGGTDTQQPPPAPLTRVVLAPIHLVVHVHGQLLKQAVAELRRDGGNIKPGAGGGTQSAEPPPPHRFPAPCSPLAASSWPPWPARTGPGCGVHEVGGHKVGVIPILPPLMLPRCALCAPGSGAWADTGPGRGVARGEQTPPPPSCPPKGCAEHPEPIPAARGDPWCECQADNTSVPCTWGAPCAPEAAVEGRTG